LPAKTVARKSNLQNTFYPGNEVQKKDKWKVNYKKNLQLYENTLKKLDIQFGTQEN